MSRYRILTLDGGGIRGVLTAVLLERLKGAVPGFLEGTDLYAGSSTGGILALALAAGVDPTELRNLYEARGAVIFDDTIWDDVVDLGKLRGADYDNQGLRRELKRVLGRRTRLKDLQSSVVVTSFDLDNEHPDPEKRYWKPKIFHNLPGPDSDGDQPAYLVGLYTSAAPTYFPSVDGYIDGGVVANNPSMVALAQTQDRRAFPKPPALSDVRLLSLGTGMPLTYVTGRRLDWGYTQWIKPLVNLMLDGTMGVADFQCRQFLAGNYHRLAPVFPANTAFPTDDVGKIPDLIEYARNTDITPTLDWLRDCWV